MRPPLVSDIPDLRRMIEIEGKSVRYCAKHYRCSVTTISTRMTEYDIKRSRHGNSIVSDHDADLIAQLILGGLTVAETAEKMEVTDNDVRRILQRKGISIMELRRQNTPINDLLNAVRDGVTEPSIITKSGKPVGVLLPYNEQTKALVK